MDIDWEEVSRLADLAQAVSLSSQPNERSSQADSSAISDDWDGWSTVAAMADAAQQQQAALDRALIDDIAKRESRMCGEQLAVVEAAMRGENVLLTGSAGTGKSFTLDLIISKLCIQYSQAKVVVSAPTGVAASHLQHGTTIHSAAGIGVPTHVQDDFGKMWKPSCRDHWRNLRTLIIDEISMLSGEFFDRLECTVRDLRKSPKPFGGIQVILCGAPAEQLPPIVSKIPSTVRERLVEGELPERVMMKLDSSRRPKAPVELHVDRGEIFQSTAFWSLGLAFFELKVQHRQRKAEVEFIHILDRIKDGSFTQEDLNVLNRKCVAERPDSTFRSASVAARAAKDDAVAAASRPRRRLELYPVNSQADLVNMTAFNSLDAATQRESRAYDFVVPHDTPYIGGFPNRSAQFDALRNCAFWKNGGCRLKRTVNFRLRARVILLRNLDLETEPLLVNGSMGVIVAWMTAEMLESSLLRLTTELKAALVAAGFLGSEHDDENFEKFMCGDAAITDFSRRFVTSALYFVVLEKAKQVTWLRGVLQSEGGLAAAPVIEFDNGRKQGIIPSLDVQEQLGVGLACRLQLPLGLGYALTVHKSQGMSIDALKVDPRRTFADGQAYVALSRATSAEYLELASPLTARHIRTSPLLGPFHRTIRNAANRPRITEPMTDKLLASSRGEVRGSSNYKIVKRFLAENSLGLHWREQGAEVSGDSGSPKRRMYPARDGDGCLGVEIRPNAQVEEGGADPSSLLPESPMQRRRTGCVADTDALCPARRSAEGVETVEQSHSVIDVDLVTL